MNSLFIIIFRSTLHNLSYLPSHYMSHKCTDHRNRRFVVLSTRTWHRTSSLVGWLDLLLRRLTAAESPYWVANIHAYLINFLPFIEGEDSVCSHKMFLIILNLLLNAWRAALDDVMHVRNFPWSCYEVGKDSVYAALPRDKNTTCGVIFVGV